MTPLQMTRAGNTGYRLGRLVADLLPKRQCEALLYTAQGYTDKQAAEQMDCAPATVKHLRQAVHYRCDSHTGPELVTRAFERGYLRLTTLAFAWLLGLGTLTAPQPTTADEDQAALLRLRTRRTRRQRTQQRTDGLYWDEETTTLYLGDRPLATLAHPTTEKTHDHQTTHYRPARISQQRQKHQRRNPIQRIGFDTHRLRRCRYPSLRRRTWHGPRRFFTAA